MDTDVVRLVLETQVLITAVLVLAANELRGGIEPPTSSLPRTCSTD